MPVAGALQLRAPQQHPLLKPFSLAFACFLFSLLSQSRASGAIGLLTASRPWHIFNGAMDIMMHLLSPISLAWSFYNETMFGEQSK